MGEALGWFLVLGFPVFVWSLGGIADFLLDAFRELVRMEVRREVAKIEKERAP